MLKVHLKIFFVFFTVASVTSDNTFHPVLQGYRKGFLNSRALATESLDKSFFDVYNALNGIINGISNTYTRNIQGFNRSCTNFRYSTSKNSTASRLVNFCGSILDILEYTSNELDDVMKVFHYGQLGADTEPMKAAEYIWESGENNLNTLPFYYSKSSSCLSASLESYLKIFSKNVELIVAASTSTTKNMTNLFSSVSTTASATNRFIIEMTNDLNNCSKLDDSTKCVKEFLSDYTSCDDKKKCAADQLQKTIKACTEKVFSLRSEYYEIMADVKQQIEEIDDDFEKWIDRLNKCIANRTPSVNGAKSTKTTLSTMKSTTSGKGTTTENSSGRTRTNTRETTRSNTEKSTESTGRTRARGNTERTEATTEKTTSKAARTRTPTSTTTPARRG